MFLNCPSPVLALRVGISILNINFIDTNVSIDIDWYQCNINTWSNYYSCMHCCCFFTEATWLWASALPVTVQSSSLRSSAYFFKASSLLKAIFSLLSKSIGIIMILAIFVFIWYPPPLTYSSVASIQVKVKVSVLVNLSTGCIYSIYVLLCLHYNFIYRSALVIIEPQAPAVQTGRSLGFIYWAVEWTLMMVFRSVYFSLSDSVPHRRVSLV